MSPNILAHFSCLDELIQVIYQSLDRFVVLSSASDDEWIVHVGLSGAEGRWWRGSWAEADVLKLIGSNASEILIESFAEKLAETIVQGEICITDWTVDPGAEIKLTLGPSSKRPLHIPLVELSSSDAASYATTVFLDIALQAQSRKCQLHGGSISSNFTTPAPAAVPSKSSRDPKPHTPVATSASSSSKAPATKATSSADSKAQEEIQNLKAELAKQKKRKEKTPDVPESKTKGVRPMKGASLANPNKKARKYQAIEFASDEE